MPEISNGRIYKPGYAAKNLRGIDEGPRPWDIQKIILEKASQFTHPELLDIGCGTCEKILFLADFFHHIYAIEPNPNMCELSKKIIAASTKGNISLYKACAEQIPLANESVDIATAMISVWDEKEIFRVLRSGGYAIIETVANHDKENLKYPFGRDEQGWRGQKLNFQDGELTNKIQNELASCFKEVNVREGYWTTYYSYEGLIKLFQETSSMRHFDEQKDVEALNYIKENFATPKGIKTYQHRILAIARK